MEELSSSLLTCLMEYSKRSTIPMHMPGHKRNISPAPYLSFLGAAYDITEIDGFDNLHQATGILKQGMERAAKLWGSDHAFFLVGGSTCGILAGIRGATQYGDSVLLARNCHQSVYHAIEINGLKPHFLLPPIDDTFDIYGSLPPETVEQALDQHPNISLIILTSPTYDGVVTDVKSICHLAHKHNIPVLVDEAHGAHFGLSPSFPNSAIQAGADLVIQSLHKTLPSLTQTAIAHLNGTRISPQSFAKELRIFETSSPSYLLLASIDECVRFLESHPSLLKTWASLLADFDAQIASLRHFCVLCHGMDRKENHPILFQFDPSKLLISTKETSYSGPELMRCLRNEFDIELEMASPFSVLAMTGALTSKEHLDRLATALSLLDKRCSIPSVQKRVTDKPPALSLPQQILSPGEVRRFPYCLRNAEDAIGHIAGEYIWSYPPGIPLLIPGEQISFAFLEQLRFLQSQGVSIHSTSGFAPTCFKVIDDINGIKP